MTCARSSVSEGQGYRQCPIDAPHGFGGQRAQVIAELVGGYDQPRYVVADRRQRYGLSPDTWTLARKELEREQLLTVARTPMGSDFDYQRMRNTYWVDLEALKTRSPDLRQKSLVE